jgi:AcrR family transcriptional regulator
MEPLHSEAKERVLAAAEQLFAERGYTAVTVKDIAAAVGIRHASLYHHFPGGKEELYMEVMERHFKHHAVGLQQVLAQAEPHLRAQLQAAAFWLLSQPPLDLIRLTHSDLPALPPEQANRLSHLAFQSLLIPLFLTFRQARERGEIEHHNLNLVAGAFLGMIESLYAIPRDNLMQSYPAMADDLIDALLVGLLKR